MSLESLYVLFVEDTVLLLFLYGVYNGGNNRYFLSKLPDGMLCKLTGNWGGAWTLVNFFSIIFLFLANYGFDENNSYISMANLFACIDFSFYIFDGNLSVILSGYAGCIYLDESRLL